MPHSDGVLIQGGTVDVFYPFKMAAAREETERSTRSAQQMSCCCEDRGLTLDSVLGLCLEVSNPVVRGQEVFSTKPWCRIRMLFIFSIHTALIFQYLSENK
ncbi:unnamed protein product [Pieris macdunnoughi]|uniref:Uncharacterized protein n=1 Tax=Pieris macdunnoughi TaxID=345717 RepID=A0A821S6P0_9NEOP|nr:unnamed protein product [Pieris macdunnoughi]